MAHPKSAQKRARQSIKSRQRNRRRKAGVKKVVRAYEEALSAEQPDQAAGVLKQVYQRLDKAAAKGTMHKKTVARKKSRLAKRLKKQAAQ